MRHDPPRTHDYRNPRSEPSHSSDVVFFFQAEDGIRDVAVTGVQTCALPICGRRRRAHRGRDVREVGVRADAPRDARDDRLARHPLGAPGPPARLLEEPPGRRDQPRVDPRAPHDPRLRDGGSARAGHRPRVPPQGRARRRAVRARPEEQGQGVADPMTLGELPTPAALPPPQAEAVVDGARRLSYAELDARAATAARGFRRLGVGKRDRVLIALKNRLEHVVAYWALQKLGGVATPRHFCFAPAGLGDVLAGSGAEVALFEDATAPAVTEAARPRPVRPGHVGADAPAGATPFDELVGGGGAIGATRVPRMGYVDADGDLYVAGRGDDMIISGGRNNHPGEGEEALARHPGVKDVAVAGEADERLGERVAAFVVPGAGVTAEELDRFCRESPDLASFKRPRRFVFLKEIPKTASGKILRRLLREGRYTEGHP